MGFFNTLTNAAKSLYGAAKSGIQSIPNVVNKAADAVYSAYRSSPASSLQASIGQGLNPTQKAQAESSLYTKGYASPGSVTGTVNPTNFSENRLYTPVDQPNVSTPYGSGYASPAGGNIVLTEPSPVLPNYPTPYTPAPTQPTYTPAPQTYTPAPAYIPPPTINPLNANRQYQYIVDNNGQVTKIDVTPTGEYGNLGLSSNQNFISAGGSTGVTGISGGSSLLPGSAGGGLRFAGGMFEGLMTAQEEKDKRTSLLRRSTGNPSSSIAPYGTTMFSPSGSPLFAGLSPDQFSALGKDGILSTNPPTGINSISSPESIAASKASITSLDTKRFGGTTIKRPPDYLTNPPPSLSGKELTPSQQGLLGNIGTQSSTERFISDKASEIFSANNAAKDVIKNDLISQQNDNAIKQLSETTGWTPDQVAQYIQTDPQGRLMYDQTFQAMKDQVISPLTNEPYIKEDFQIQTPEYADAIANIDKSLSQYQIDTDAKGQLLSLQTQAQLPDLNTELRKIRDDADLLNNTFETLRDDVRNDPDFSKTLKARRMDFIDDKNRRALILYQQKEKNLVDEIAAKEKLVADQYKAWADTQSLRQKERDTLLAQRNTIVDQMERASDNARDAMKGLVENPELLKGTTDAQLQRELSYISKTGLYPETMLKRLSTNAGVNIAGVARFQTTAGTSTLIGYTKDGKTVQLGTYKDVSQSSGGGSTVVSPTIGADVARYQAAIGKILNDPNKTSGTKTTEIAALTGEIYAKYPGTGNKNVLDSAFGNPSSLGGQINPTINAAEDDAFNKDLSSSLSVVRSTPWYSSTKSAAQKAKQDLLTKYPSRTAAINAAFSGY